MSRRSRRAGDRGTNDAIHELVVAHGPPLRGGIATVAADLVDDPGLNAEFDIEFFNTAQNDEARGKFSLANITRVTRDATETFRRSRAGTVVHPHSVHYPAPVVWRQVAVAAAARLRGAAVLNHNHAQPPYMEGPGEWEISRLNAWGFAVLDRLVEATILIAAAGVPNIRRYMAHAELPVVHNSIVVDDVVQSTAVHDPPVVLRDHVERCCLERVDELAEVVGVDALGQLREARDVDEADRCCFGGTERAFFDLEATAERRDHVAAPHVDEQRFDVVADAREQLRGVGGDLRLGDRPAVAPLELLGER